MDTEIGLKKFFDKYGIEFSSLIEIPKHNDEGIYKQNYKVMYDKTKNRIFSLWSSPYKYMIYISGRGFITEDKYLKKFYLSEIKEIQKLTKQ
jgi:hypothetical protein